ncbi:Werner syndrome ATP-dependent helicase homolog [Ricinus communis]|uniref:3'-5' exonuclease, putative n=1 Tax=Ricinus communis TaxID=3988 RepID=B9SRJ8_RICCO|nr:Werner syndrome ATP-dependent helicase homolog [Ricinus communis]EEF33775.1 3'-5' exonuclease, putative [Ricinus communis]|eukprot:XP_002528617.1 Werner syndrome ATP-dependent helicase homolog [Ricinus communis]
MEAPWGAVLFKEEKESHTLYTVQFFDNIINVTLTSSAVEAIDWLNKTLSLHYNLLEKEELVVGIGVQWNPIKDDNQESCADILQLCIGDRCLIFQLSVPNAEFPVSLRTFLSNGKKKTFAGTMNVRECEKMLLKSRHQVEISRLFHVRNHAISASGERLVDKDSVGEVVEKCLGYQGMKFQKAVTGSKWDDLVLNDDQVLLATVGAYVSFRIAKKCRAWKWCGRK